MRAAVTGLSVAAFLPIILSPLAGFFYWQKAKRPEKVVLQLQASSSDQLDVQSLLTVTAHRDELLQLQRALPLKPAE
ncbi:MAG: cofactor assembly of complex C subunit B [Leptolyngbyaceae cyanobacterium CAN_BIN12]|nr:cofactor assembly of complex C subunit B [Leptolyngbyaceae cyanobacterium CAN_BIN12]